MTAPRWHKVVTEVLTGKHVFVPLEKGGCGGQKDYGSAKRKKITGNTRHTTP